MTSRIVSLSLFFLLLWVGLPALLALTGSAPVVLLAADQPALLWLSALVLLVVLTSLALGYRSRSRFLLGACAALLAIVPPVFVSYPLIFIRAANPVALSWFGVSIVGTLLLLIYAGGAARRSDDERTHLQLLLRLTEHALGGGLALYDRKLRLLWANETARPYLNLETERLARHTLETAHLSSQSYNLDETTRLSVQALPLDQHTIGLSFTRLRYENDQFYERFIRRIVHDMRNPLAAIIAHAGNLRTAAAFDQSSLATIEHEAGRLTRLVDSILFDARLAYVPLAIEQIDLLDVLEEVYYQHDERALREDKLLHLEALTDSAPVEADRDLLVRAISNLVDNSLKYSPSGARITLLLAAAPSHYVVRVSDTGDGIPPEYLPDRIFEALVRARPKDGGSGLGLSIVRKIIEMHRGTITVESVLGKGTTFTICLQKTPFSS